MNPQRGHRVRLIIILGLILLVLLGGGIAAAPHVIPMVESWLNGTDEKKETAGQDGTAPRLVRDAQGHYGLELAPDVEKALFVQSEQARKVTKDKALPELLGQTAYDIDFLYPVRSIGNGKVIKIAELFDPLAGIESKRAKYRQIGFGDEVKEGDLLAVVRSPDLAEKKGAYVDALLDLNVDRKRLLALDGPYEKGSIPEATYRDAVARVEKDILTKERAKRILELVPLKPHEIKALEKTADAIKERFRELAKPTASDTKELWPIEQVDEWARVEVRAPRSGVIVEKNTNVGDIVDPGKDPPLFRVANLRKLSVWIHPPEEYLPVLKKLLKENAPEKIRLELQLQSVSSGQALKGYLLRFAPSLDPNMRTPLLLGRIENSDEKDLLVGQLLKVTIYVPEKTGLVSIPTDALNDVHGQSLVFVQVRGFFGGKPRYMVRRVQVAQRFHDVVQVCSAVKLTDKEQAKLAEEIERGLLPIEPLKPGEWVVTGGVVEMTDALENLKTKQKNQKIVKDDKSLAKTK